MLFWAHWKARSGLHISVNWTFFAGCYGWSATNENRSKIGDFAPTRSVWPKISGRKVASTSKKPVADFFFKRSVILDGNRPFCVYESTFAGLRSNVYDDHLRLIVKRVVGFLLVLIELFSLGVTGWGAASEYRSKSVISLQRGPVGPNFQVEGLALYQPFFLEN